MSATEAAMQSPGGKRTPSDDGIDATNIICGKRRRKPTRRLVDSKEWQDEYQQLILEDVPENEVEAALLDDQLDADTDDDDNDDDDNDEDEDVLSEESDDFIVTDDEDENAEEDVEYTDSHSSSVSDDLSEDDDE